MARSVVDILKSHSNICFYPSAGVDFRDVIYLSEVYYELKGFKDDCEFPDLFVHVDANPNSEYTSYYDQTNQIKFEQGREIGHSDLDLLKSNNYSAILKSDKYLYKADKRGNTNKSLPRTIIKVTSIERLSDLSASLLGFADASFFNRAFYMEVKVETTKYGKTTSWNTAIIYAFTDNMAFMRDVILNYNIDLAYAIQLRYDQLINSCRWVKCCLPLCNAKRFIATENYVGLNWCYGADDFCKEFFDGYSLDDYEMKDEVYRIPANHWGFTNLDMVCYIVKR